MGSKWQGELGAGVWAGALRQAPPDAYQLCSGRVTGVKCKGVLFDVHVVLISELSYTLAPLGAEWSYYAVQNWVRAHGQRVGQTAYFEIYAPPTAP